MNDDIKNKTLLLLLLIPILVSMSNAEPNWLVKQVALSGIDFRFENDMFGSEGTDQHYTNGWQALLPLRYSGPISWLPLEFLGDSVSHGSGWVLGQTMYTPKNISLSEAQPEDRPYAGYLYVGRQHNFYLHFKNSSSSSQSNMREISQKPGLASNALHESTLGSDNNPPSDDFDFENLETAIDSLPNPHPSARLNLRVAVGMSGKYSYAEESQTFVHKNIATRAPIPKGWSHQVPTEAIVQLAARLEWQYMKLPFNYWINAQEAGLRWLDFGQELSADVGTFYNQLSLAMLLRFGLMESPYVTGTENIITKAPKGEGVKAALANWMAGWRLYTFAQPRALLVLHNSAIECGFRPCEVSQEGRLGVLDLEIGARASLPIGGLWRINGAYTLDWRSTEVATDDWELLEHSFGAWQIGIVRGIR